MEVGSTSCGRDLYFGIAMAEGKVGIESKSPRKPISVTVNKSIEKKL